MRHISLLTRVPDDDWLARAAVLLDELRGAANDAARKKIITDNRGFWGELKQWLLELSHGKCWFSEAKDCFNHWDVEHYRPKGAVKDDDAPHDEGYWWLAFDWRNFRICGNAGNRKKGAYFPIRGGSARVQPFGDLRYEQPALLDPIDEDDPVLIFFNIEGHAVPAPHITDEWERARVVCSVERYNLDFAPLMDGRKTVWAECWNRLQEYFNELALYQRDATNMIARDRFKQAAKRVREMIRDDQQFSAVARACIESAGDPRGIGLLRSA